MIPATPPPHLSETPPTPVRHYTGLSLTSGESARRAGFRVIQKAAFVRQ